MVKKLEEVFHRDWLVNAIKAADKEVRFRPDDYRENIFESCAYKVATIVPESVGCHIPSYFAEMFGLTPMDFDEFSTYDDTMDGWLDKDGNGYTFEQYIDEKVEWVFDSLERHMDNLYSELCQLVKDAEVSGDAEIAWEDGGIYLMYYLQVDEEED